ncbi:MAG: extracellular solute-binding protein [Eubacteriales bacterium]
MKVKTKVKLRYVLVLMLIIFLFAGCIQAPTQGQPGGEAPAIIAVWHTLQGEEEKELLKQIERINDEYPEVTVKAEYIAEDKFISTIWNVQAGGEGPEIFIARRQIIQALYEKGALAPVLADEKNTFSAARAIFYYNNKSYAASWLTDVPLFYYRSDRVSTPSATIDEVFGRKAVVGIPDTDTALLSPWWKSKGGALSESGVAVLDSTNNISFATLLAYLHSEGLLRIDKDCLNSFIKGDINYMISWASNSPILTANNVKWSVISPVVMFGTGGNALLSNTLGIANSSIKTGSGTDETIRLVENELISLEVEAAMSKVDRRIPLNNLFYSNAQANSYLGQTAKTLENALVLKGSALDWNYLDLQNAAWRSIVAGGNISEEITAAQKKAIESEK